MLLRMYALFVNQNDLRLLNGNSNAYFSILLTVHPNTWWFKYDRDWFVQTYTQISPGHIWTTLYNNSVFYQLDAQILYFNTLITSLYMFRALLCSSSGGQICISAASGIVTLLRWLLRKDFLNLCAEQSLKDSDDTRCCINTLRTGLLNCWNARSRGLTFRHRASCI